MGESLDSPVDDSLSREEAISSGSKFIPSDLFKPGSVHANRIAIKRRVQTMSVS
jgi:hypothetical protein